MTTKQKKILLVTLLVGVAVLAVGAVLYLDVRSGGDSDNSIFPFIPIWIAIFVPTIVASRQQREAEAREKAKRELEDEDIYAVMDNLVDDMDADERQYLRQRIVEEHGDFIMDTY